MSQQDGPPVHIPASPAPLRVGRNPYILFLGIGAAIVLAIGIVFAVAGVTMPIDDGARSLLERSNLLSVGNALIQTGGIGLAVFGAVLALHWDKARQR